MFFLPLDSPRSPVDTFVVSSVPPNVTTPYFLSQSMPHSALHDSSQVQSGTKTISFADEPSLSATLHVSPYSPVRVGNSLNPASFSDSAVAAAHRFESTDNVSLSELADVFNSQDEAALLSSLFFEKVQQVFSKLCAYLISPVYAHFV